MKLSLSLDASLNKLDRAQQHFETLIIEAVKAQDEVPFELTFGEPDSGRWITVSMCSKQLNLPSVALIAGDVVQNLRASLDYVVAAAVDAVPSLVLTRKHQFPIYDSANKFARDVAGDDLRAKKNGFLHGLPATVVDIVRRAQPFNLDGCSALEAIGNLSNTDKHRMLLTSAALFTGAARITAHPHEAIEELVSMNPPSPIPGLPVEVVRVRTRDGSMGLKSVTVETPGEVAVISPAFDGLQPLVLPIAEIPTLIGEVRQLVLRFAEL